MNSLIILLITLLTFTTCYTASNEEIELQNLIAPQETMLRGPRTEDDRQELLNQISNMHACEMIPNKPREALIQQLFADIPVGKAHPGIKKATALLCQNGWTCSDSCQLGIFCSALTCMLCSVPSSCASECVTNPATATTLRLLCFGYLGAGATTFLFGACCGCCSPNLYKCCCKCDPDRVILNKLSHPDCWPQAQEDENPRSPQIMSENHTHYSMPPQIALGMGLAAAAGR